MKQHTFEQQILLLHQQIDKADLYQHLVDSEINWEYYYYKLFGKVPQCISFNEYDIDKTLFDQKLTDAMGDDVVKLTTMHYLDASDNDKHKLNGAVYLIKHEAMLYLRYVSYSYYYSDQTPTDLPQQLLELMKQSLQKNEDLTDKIYILNNRPHTGYYFDDFEIKQRPLDLHTNYNDDLIATDEIICKRLSTERDKGLVILYGKPGTGKTSYIRHLIHNVKKRKLFIPPGLAQHIADPQFISLLNSYQDSVLIIEDAENIIQSRHAQSSSAISNLLNLTDGLLSDCFSIQIICTFNGDIAHIDKALLRKGRLIAKYEFKELSAHKAQALSKSLGFADAPVAPATLADIYNQGELATTTDAQRSIGF